MSNPKFFMLLSAILISRIFLVVSLMLTLAYSFFFVWEGTYLHNQSNSSMFEMIIDPMDKLMCNKSEKSVDACIAINNKAMEQEIAVVTSSYESGKLTKDSFEQSVSSIKNRYHHYMNYSLEKYTDVKNNFYENYYHITLLDLFFSNKNHIATKYDNNRYLVLQTLSELTGQKLTNLFKPYQFTDEKMNTSTVVFNSVHSIFSIFMMIIIQILVLSLTFPLMQMLIKRMPKNIKEKTQLKTS